LPAHSAIFLPLLLLDIQGVPQLEERVLPQLHAVANAPLFGIWRTQLGRGIVGGPLLDFEELSLNAARIAARILQGEAPGGLRVPPQAPGIPEFDWGELRRWGIREASLPTGSVVRFRQPTFWQLYRWPVTGIGLFCCAQAALIIVLLVNRTRRRQSEAINQATFDQAAVGIAHVGLDGRWLRVNDRMCAIVGYPREELLQLTFQDLTHPDDLEPDLHRVRQLLSGELHTYSMEKRYLRKDRSVVWGNLGARFFLRKPVDDQALLDAIRWVVEGTHPHPAAP
jgi:PAS domain S-box-containing protein